MGDRKVLSSAKAGAGWQMLRFLPVCASYNTGILAVESTTAALRAGYEGRLVSGYEPGR